MTTTVKNVVGLESVLVADKKYMVQEVSKFSSKKAFLIGKSVVFKGMLTASTATVLHGGNKHEIPARSLIAIPDFVAKSVATKNADAFAVCMIGHPLFKVGTYFINPEKVGDKEITVTYEGKTHHIPLEFLCNFVKIQSDKKIKTLNHKDFESTSSDSTFKVKTADRKVLNDIIKGLDYSELLKDITLLPAQFHKLLPNLNTTLLIEEVRNASGVYADYDGNVHSTIKQAQESNLKISRAHLVNNVMALIVKELKNAANLELSKELQERGY